MKRIPLLFILLTLISCWTIPVFEVGVSSIGEDTKLGEKTFILLPTNEVASNQLLFREVEKFILKALKKNGYILTENINDAKYAIIVDYGISDPKEKTYSYNAPVFGQTGISSSRTTGFISSSGSTATVQSSTQYTPQYGVTGYTTQQGSYTVYSRHLNITAYDLQLFLSTKQEKQIWYLSAVSTGSSNDLRLVLPVIIAASNPYLGKNSGKTQLIKLYENSPSVLEITED